MSFYLSPPSGEIPYQKLEVYSLKRLQFLIRLLACRDDVEVEEILQDADVVDQSDCLITGTTKDSVSHHMLRLILCGDPETKSFFVKAEQALFKLRIERMFEHEWKDFFRSLARAKLKTDENSVAFQCTAFSNLMQVYKIIEDKSEDWRTLATDMCVSRHSTSWFDLPFNFALNLVSKRQVDIHKGIASVPVSFLKEIFMERFEELTMAMADKAVSQRPFAMRDARIKRLAAVLKRAYRSEAKPNIYLPENFSPLRLSDLWAASTNFPPCMSQLVKVLQDRHRLRHHDRIQLTLFLKDLGLPIHDALLLWKHEYSVPAAAEIEGCQHGWQGNQRRYIYNIRHLYGLEGSRIDYRAHSCKSLQGRSLSCGEAGDCPFVSLDDSSLKAFLAAEADLSGESLNDVVGHAQNKHYGRACFHYMLHKMQKSSGKPRSIQNQRSDLCERALETTEVIAGPVQGVRETEEYICSTETETHKRIEQHSCFHSGFNEGGQDCFSKMLLKSNGNIELSPDKSARGLKHSRCLTYTGAKSCDRSHTRKRKKTGSCSTCSSSLDEGMKSEINKNVCVRPDSVMPHTEICHAVIHHTCLYHPETHHTTCCSTGKRNESGTCDHASCSQKSDKDSSVTGDLASHFTGMCHTVCCQTSGNRDMNVTRGSGIHHTAVCQTANRDTSASNNSGIDHTACCQTVQSNCSFNQNLSLAYSCCQVQNVHTNRGNTSNSWYRDQNHVIETSASHSNRFVGLKPSDHGMRQHDLPVFQTSLYCCRHNKIFVLPSDKSNEEHLDMLRVKDNLPTLAKKMYVKSRGKKLYMDNTAAHSELQYDNLISLQDMQSLADKDLLFQKLDNSSRNAQTVCECCQSSPLTCQNHSENVGRTTHLKKGLDESAPEHTQLTCTSTSDPMFPDRRKISHSQLYQNSREINKSSLYLHSSPTQSKACVDKNSVVFHSTQSTTDRETHHEKTSVCIRTSKTDNHKKSETLISHKEISIDRPSDYYWTYKKFLCDMKKL